MDESLLWNSPLEIRTQYATRKHLTFVSEWAVYGKYAEYFCIKKSITTRCEFFKSLTNYALNEP